MPALQRDRDWLDGQASRLYSAVLSDVLDSLGFRTQALAPRLRPLWPEAVVVGRAHTVLTVDVFDQRPDPYRLEIEAVDSLQPGDVLLAATGPSTRTCFWGELLSTAAQQRGARGAIIDGYTRDLRRIRQLAFPVFATGAYPVDSAGRSMVVEYGGAIACGDVVIHEGDLIFGDEDGIVALPRQAEEEAIRKALEKVEGENRTRNELEQGMTLTDVYAKYGVL